MIVITICLPSVVCQPSVTVIQRRYIAEMLIRHYAEFTRSFLTMRHASAATSAYAGVIPVTCRCFIICCLIPARAK